LLRIEPRQPTLDSNEWAVAEQARIPQILRRDEEAAEAVPVLRELLKDADGEVRLTAVVELARSGQEAEAAIPEFTEALADNYKNIRVQAADFLWRLTRQEENLLPVLTKALRDPQNSVAAARCLEEIGPKAKQALVPLIAAMKEKGPPPQLEWLQALAALRPGDRLNIGLSRKENRLAEQAIRALGAIGPDAAPAVPALTEALGNADASVRIAAAAALWKIGNRSQTALAILTESVHGPRGNEAAQGLGEIGPAAREAIPVLTAALKTQDGTTLAPWAERVDVRIVAAFALWRVDPQTKLAVPALVDALKNPDFKLRLQTVQALTTMGPAAREAVPALIAGVGDSVVRIDAIRALGAIGPEAKAALPVLKGALRNQRAPVRRAALDAIKQIDPAAVPMHAPLSISPWFWVAIGLLAGYGVWTWFRHRRLEAAVSTAAAPVSGEALPPPREPLMLGQPEPTQPIRSSSEQDTSSQHWLGRRLGFVSVWIGAFPAIEAAEAYFGIPDEIGAYLPPEAFARDFGLGDLPPDTLEVHFEQQSMRPLPELLKDAAFSGSFVEAAVAAASRQGIDEAQGVALLYDFDYRAKPEPAVAVGPLRFLGTFPFVRIQPIMKLELVEDLARDLGYPVAAAHFVITAFLELKNHLQEQGNAPVQITGRQLCDYILGCRGQETAAILRQSGLRRSEDVGRVVFGLVKLELLHRHASDSEADFEGVFALQ